MFNCKPYEVEHEISIFTTAEHEDECLEQFLDGPECKEDLIEDLFDLDAFEIQKCSNFEDISATLQNDQIKIHGCSDGVHPNLMEREGNGLKGVKEGYVQGENILSRCGDFFLDAKVADKALNLDHGACKDPLLGNAGLGSPSPGINKKVFQDAKHADEVFILDQGACPGPFFGNTGLGNQSPDTNKGYSMFQDVNRADKASGMDNGAGNDPFFAIDGLESNSLGINKQNSGDEMTDFSLTSSPLVKYVENHESLFLNFPVDKEEREILKTMYEHETVGKNRHWFNQRELVSSKNYVVQSSLDLLTCTVSSTNHGDRTMSSTSTEYPKSATSCVSETLIGQSMSGDRQMKRKKCTGGDSWKTSYSGVSKVHFSSLNEKDKGGSSFSLKRSRKPPKRYIEESLKYELKSHSIKFGVSCRKSKDGLLRVKSQKCQDDSFSGSCIQVPFGLPIEKEHPEQDQALVLYESWKDSRPLASKKKLDIGPDSPESQEYISDGGHTPRSLTVNSSGKRKRHISWTPAEVENLIEGVSQYGVGRWTEIKKVLFSSSSHRTSVDLKDKWRNLLRACSAMTQMKKKVEQGRKQSWVSQQVQESVLWRVRELSVMHPYPRENRSKIYCTAPAVPSLPAPTSNLLAPLTTTF